MNVLESFRLDGKTALVAMPEAPYGKAVALALCEAGARVYLASDNKELMEAVAEEIRKEGFVVKTLEYNPAVEESIVNLKDAILADCGRIDIFVLNAGERFTEGWNGGTSQELYANLEKNQIGTMLSTRIIGNAIAQNGTGSVIFISSVYGLVGPDPHNTMECPEMEAYDYSLDRVFIFGGYVNYARQAASYLGQFNVRVNTICTAPLDKPEKYSREFAKRTTLLRNPRENDIKGLVVYLASDASSYVTGVAIPVDGGYVAK